MKPLRVIHVAVVLMIAARQLTNPSFAASSAKLTVSATVLPWINFNASQHVAAYEVRSEDLKKGYVDLPNSITVTLSTNVNREITIMVDNWGIGMIMIKESGTENFSKNSLALNIAGYGSGALISKKIDSRIMLPADAKEGVYPLAISLTPAI